MPDLKSLLDSADDLRVSALAVKPWCALPQLTTVAETYETATDRGYDVLPVRVGAAPITQTVATKWFQGETSWNAVLRRAEPLTAERLVAREASAFRLLDRLQEYDVLFTLGQGGVDGVVTIYDLNQPGAHLLGFGMALICESDVSLALRRELGEDPQIAFERAHRVVPGSRGLRAWKRARRAGRELHVASALMLGEKLEVLRNLGLKELASAHGITESDLDRELDDVLALRNAIAHYDEDDDRLDDPRWTFEKMRVAQRFADRVVDREYRS